MYRKTYPTDIPDYVWHAIQPYIPDEKPGGRPRDTNIREVINGILYVLNNDVSWRKLPNDLLPWQTVYDYFNKWRKNGTWNSLCLRLVEHQVLDPAYAQELLATAS